MVKCENCIWFKQYQCDLNDIPVILPVELCIYFEKRENYDKEQKDNRK